MSILSDLKEGVSKGICERDVGSKANNFRLAILSETTLKKYTEEEEKRAEARTNFKKQKTKHLTFKW